MWCADKKIKFSLHKTKTMKWITVVQNQVLNLKEIIYFNNRKEQILIKENNISLNQKCQNEALEKWMEKNKNTK